jgi:hypothetical protein
MEQLICARARTRAETHVVEALAGMLLLDSDRLHG